MAQQRTSLVPVKILASGHETCPNLSEMAVVMRIIHEEEKQEEQVGVVQGAESISSLLICY